MNINLVSDESNGYQYTSYFGEDIVIEPGSKTYLNYATLFRQGENVLTQDGTMTLTATELLPRKVISGGAPIDNVISEDFVIPAGTYTGLELQEKITSLITDFTGTTEGNQLRYYFSNPQEETVPEGQGKLAVSLCFDIDNWSESFDFVLSVDDKFNAQTFGGGADGYEKVEDTLSTDTQTYDNYGTPDDDFWHYSYDSTKKPYEALVDFTFETSHTGSVLVGLYGNKYATLTDPAGATPPMTTGTITPVLYTVDQPVEDVDPALGFSNSVDKTEIGGSDIILNAPAGSFYEGFKVELTSTTSTAASYGYVNVIPTPGSEGVLDFGSITGTITGLAPNTSFDLSTAGGTGTGFILTVESNAAGEIPPGRITPTDAKITAPGSGYIVGDVLTLTETTTPGTGSVSITVTKLCNQGNVISFRWTNGNSSYEVSPWDDQVAALSMGSGFVGGQSVTISQDSNAGGTTDTMSITEYSTSANFMVPACFVAVEFRGGNSQPTSLAQVAEVYMAQDSSGHFIGARGGNTDWTSQDKAIKRMKKIAQFSYVAGGPRKHLGLRTYYSTAVDSDYQGDRKKLYFRVVDITAGEDAEDYVLFDSINTGHYFPFDFFTGIDPTTEDEVEIQVPFRVFVSAQSEDEGFRDIRYSVYDRIKAGASDQYQASICEKATLSFSSELKKILGLTSGIDLFPSSQPSDPLTFEILDLALFWANKSYYVVVQELPLTNYKNRRAITADGSGRVKKGMIKNILANIPLPFEAVSTSLKPAAAGVFTGGLYEPNKKIIVDLQNQKIVTNRLTVQIFRMEDDTLADEIKQSIINFTIIKE